MGFLYVFEGEECDIYDVRAQSNQYKSFNTSIRFIILYEY
jgi:hypothetical protein